MPTLFRDKILVNGISFNDRPTQPVQAITWGMDVLEGWSATSDLDAVSTPFGGGIDGEVADDYQEARARYLTAGGYVLAATRGDAETLVDTIIGKAFPRNKDLTLIRYENTPKQMTVRVWGKREVQPVGPEAFRWIVPLMAEDPFKYGLGLITRSAGVAGLSSGGFTFPLTFPLIFTTIDAGGSQAAIFNNIGTAPTLPTVTLHGPLPRGGWRLSNNTTGQDIQFDVGLDAADVLEIDFANEIALLNGYPVTSTIIGDFWELVPGVNTISLYSTYDPAAGFDISARYAWEL